MTNTIPTQSNRGSFQPEMTVEQALTVLHDADFTIVGVAEYEQDGVRVRVTLSDAHHPMVGVSRLVGGRREHLTFEGYHTVRGLQVPFDTASAVDHAVGLAGVSDKWAVTR